MTGKSSVKLLRGEPFEGRQFVFAERGAHGSNLPGNSADFDLGRVVVICLVAIEPVSNYLILEQYAAKRDAPTWNAAVDEALKPFSVTVIQCA